MTERTERNAAIVRQLEVDANASAQVYLADVEEFQRLYRLERMQDIVFDFAEWIEESGDLKRLTDLGVAVDEDDGLLRLVQGNRSMTIRARDDMSVVVGGRILHPNADCPVLDKDFYAEVIAMVFAWARRDKTGQPRRYFE